jgi:hypothetical protein
MRSIRNLGTQPAGLPVVADDILELHAARLILLLRFCGARNRIKGLTKLAKLDFFVRYPQFFDQMCTHLGVSGGAQMRGVESAMVRFHYGPWDQRYYHVHAYLEGKGILTVRKEGNAYEFELTELGKEIADRLKQRSAFAEVTTQMKSVKDVLGAKNGSTLKNLVYEVFDQEVGQRSWGEVIR